MLPTNTWKITIKLQNRWRNLNQITGELVCGGFVLFCSGQVSSRDLFFKSRLNTWIKYLHLRRAADFTQAVHMLSGYQWCWCVRRPVTSTQHSSCVRICLWAALCMLRAALMAPPTHRLITSTFVSARWEQPLRQLWSILSYEREAAVLLSVEVFKLLAFCKDSVSSFLSCRAFGCFSLCCSFPQNKQNRDNIQILNQHSCFCLSARLWIVFEPGICAQLLTKIFTKPFQ